MNIQTARAAIVEEVERAANLHPDWPTDIIHAVAIMAEESGEAVKAAVNLVYGGGSETELREELIHTAATCIRCLVENDL